MTESVPSIKPKCMLVATDLDKLTSVTQVFNYKEWDPFYFWVELPRNIASKFQFYQLDKCEDASFQMIDIEDCWMREGYRPWIRFISSIFDKSVGMHTYALRFVDVQTHDTYNLYIRYINQVDDPDKPYYYMGNKE